MAARRAQVFTRPTVFTRPIDRARALSQDDASEAHLHGLDIDALAHLLPGKVSVEANQLASVASDLGRIISHRPRALVRPTCVDDVVAVVRSCAERREPLAVRGAAHTTFGQTLSAGVVLDLGALPIPRDEGRDDAISISAGERWSAVVTRTVARGRTLPVIPDYLGLTVGGTLTHGGIGENSYLAGVQTDHVRALEVVTGAGDHLRCSPTEHPELFESCRAGLGQCAVIVGAEMSLVPAPRQVTLYTLRFPDHRTLLSRLQAIAAEGAFEYLQATVDALAPGRYVYTLNAATAHDVGDECQPPSESSQWLASTHTLDYLDYLRRLDHVEQAMRELGVWDVPHPWAYLCLPATRAESFLGAVSEGLRGPRDGRILFQTFVRSRCRTPLFALPDCEHSVHFALLRHAVPAAREGAEAPGRKPEGLAMALVESNRQLWKVAAAVGGRLYPAGAVPMTPDDWRLQLGDRWAVLRAAKQRFDPAGILAPGRRIFE